jgi:DNA-binding MarR family transcriptional regulator
MNTVFDTISTPPEARIATGLTRIGTAMRHKAWERASLNGLTPTQADIIALLAARGEPMRLSAVAAQLAITPATASDAVTSLVGKGLADKSRAADDGRAIALSLTVAGLALSGTVSDWGGFLGLAATTLNVADKVTLLRLIIKMIRAMQENGDIPPSRMCVSCQYFAPNRHADLDTPHHCLLVDAPFGDRHLRLDCPEHKDADATILRRNWAAFAES